MIFRYPENGSYEDRPAGNMIKHILTYESIISFLKQMKYIEISRRRLRAG